MNKKKFVISIGKYFNGRNKLKKVIKVLILKWFLIIRKEEFIKRLAEKKNNN